MRQTGKYSKKRILAVDDSAIVLNRITDILRNDYEVIPVNSGVRALKYLKEERPDLILLDVRMAQQNGIETLREIRAMGDCKDIPVIMLTGVENRNTVLESSRLGISDYILKPFSSADLFKRIQRVFEQAEREDRKLPEKREELGNE